MKPVSSPDATTLAAQRTLRASRAALATSLQRVATGVRINAGADDPAGLITSEKLRSVLRELDAQSRTLERTDQVAATAEAALGEMESMLREAEGLVVAAADDAGVSAEERAAAQAQIDSLVRSVNRLADSTSFNGQKLLDGSATLTAGDTSVDLERVEVEPLDEADPETAQTNVADARRQVSDLRGKLGALARDTIGAELQRVAVTFENVAAAESAVRDTDYGLEMATAAREQLLSDSAANAVAASSKADDVLRLLG